MNQNYEPSNPLSMPFECFRYNSETHIFPIHSHWHYFAELLLVKSGTALVTVNDDLQISVNSGCMYFICPQVTHAISCSKNEHISYDVIKMDINQLESTPPYAPDIKSILMDGSQKNLPMLFDKATVQSMGIDRLVTECLREYRERNYGYDLVIRAMLYQITTQIIRQWMKNGFTIRCCVYQSDLFSSVDSITSYIDKHIREGLQVEELAAHCGMSYSGFSKKFKELYGISCKEYICRVRIAKVEHYLRFTNEDLTFVSQETGYSDCSHMIKEFKLINGITPGRYRRACRLENGTDADEA